MKIPAAKEKGFFKGFFWWKLKSHAGTVKDRKLPLGTNDLMTLLFV